MHGMIRHLKLRFPEIKLTFQKEAWNLDISRQSVTVFIALEMFGDLRKIVKIFEDDLQRRGRCGHWPWPGQLSPICPFLCSNKVWMKSARALSAPRPPPLVTPSCDARGEEGFTQFASNDTILISRGNTFEFWAQGWMNDTNDFKIFSHHLKSVKDYREASTDDILSLNWYSHKQTWAADTGWQGAGNWRAGRGWGRAPWWEKPPTVCIGATNFLQITL